MIRSLYSGISGMAAHQTKLNVIGNNIANVNTYGFKSSRVVFSDVLYQNLSTATEATETTGGTNASQLGYGTQVGSVDLINTVSSGASTGRALDVYINGEGYLAVQPDQGSTCYTRVGNLKFDADGNLTDGNGSIVMGVPMDADGNAILNEDGTLNVDELVAINVSPEDLEKCTGISIGTNGEITGIQEGDPELTLDDDATWVDSVDLPSTTNYTGDVTMAISRELEFTADSDEVTAAVVKVDDDADLSGTITLTYDGDTYTLTGTDTDGNDVSYTGTVTGNKVSFNSGAVTIKDITALTTLDEAGTEYTLGEVGAELTDPVVTVTVYDQGQTAHELEYDATTNTFSTGTTSTNKITITVDETAYATMLASAEDDAEITIGTIEAGSDVPVTLGYLAITKFANTDGLTQDGNGYFIESANSGEAVASLAGGNGTGSLESSTLEMSNVDLSQEFTDMIIAQRGFQANSRIITVSDSILEELINLKR